MPLDIADMRRKAETGSCVAQGMLGVCYLYGHDVEVDYKEAFRFLSAAAEQGASRAVLNLGRMYAQGLGIPQNMSEAIRLFEAVGRPTGSTDAFGARIELGRIFTRGVGVPIDAEAARKWYSAAIELASDEEDPEDLREARAYVAQANRSERNL
jgi:TPR repeat protein